MAAAGGGIPKGDTMKTRNPILSVAAALVLVAGCKNAPIPAVPPSVADPVLLPHPSEAVVAVPVAAPVPSAVSMVEVQVAPAVAAANRTRALLVVQQHGGTAETGLYLQQLGDWLASALGSSPFAVVNPHDVVGTTQNIGRWGEKMPEASAVELAAKIGTPVLLTASVTDARLRKVRGTDPGVQAVMEFTLSAKAVPGGEQLASVNATARSKKVSGEIAFNENAADYWSEVAKKGAYGAAPALCEEWEKGRGGDAGRAVATSVRAFFAANVPGANVRLDGVSYGTVGTEPLAVAVTPGLHNLEIAYPGMESFRDVAMIQEGSSFVTVLRLTDEAAARAKGDAYFAAILERANKSGLTDDMVREIVAKGYAQYLSQSHAQIEGMPQTLDIGGNAPSLGLDGASASMSAAIPTTAELLGKAAGQLK